MKTFIISFFALCSTVCVHGQQVFTNVSYANTRNTLNTVTFALPHEANVYNYRIEGSTDSLHFEVIGIVKSKGNTVAPRVYSYELTDNAYKYCRIALVDMDARMYYSGIITIPQDTQENRPIDKPKPASTEHPVVVNKR